MAAFAKGRADNSQGGLAGEFPALVARSPAAVAAYVEAAPVIDGNRGRRLGVRTGGDIGSRGGRSETQRNKSDGTQQKLLHHALSSFLFVLSSFLASSGPEAL